MTSNIRNNGLPPALRYLTPSFAALVILGSLIVLFEWLTDSLRVASLSSAFVPMAPATSIFFTLIGTAILIRRRRSAPRALELSSRAVMVFVLGFAIVISLQPLINANTGWSLDLENLLVPSSASGQFVAGRMSPLTSVLFVLLAAAMLVSRRPSASSLGGRIIANGLCMCVLSGDLIVLVGYWYGEPLLYNSATIPVALSTSIAFLLTASALLFEDTSGLFYHLVSSKSVSAQVCRLVIPLTVIFVLLAHYIEILAIPGANHSEHSLESSVLAITLAAVVSLGVVMASRRIQFVVDRDATAHRRAEQALEESEKRYRGLFQHMLEGFAYCRMIFVNGEPRDFVFLAVNKAFENLTGLKDVTGKKVTEVIPGIRESDPKLFEIYGRVSVTGKPERFEIFIEALKDWFSISVYSPEKEFFVAVFDVITARKQSEENFRNSLENSPLGIRIVNVDGELLYANKAMLEMYGYGAFEELRDTPGSRRYTPESYRTRLQRKARRQRGEYVPASYEISIVRKDGEVRELQAIRRDVIWNGKSEFQTIYRDITEEKRAREEVYSLARFPEENPNPVLRVRRDGVIVYANKSCGPLLSEWGSDAGNPVPDVYREPILRAIDSGSVQRLETSAAGRSYILTFAPIVEAGYVNIYGSDISERKMMEEKLIVADRMASIGELASGVAHELNNPLTSVFGFSELLLAKDLPDDAMQCVRTIHSEAMRTARIVQSLMIFARSHGLAMQPTNVNDAIQNVVALRRYKLMENNVGVKVQLAASLPAVVGDVFQLQQVFMNIITNAEYFMIQAHGKGTLAITTDELDGVVRCSFADDGPGISQENMRRLFTPFFTTKEEGKGTGLGLSISHGIVSAHQGRIYARSQLGEGATFVVELPANGGQQERTQ